MNVVFWIGAIIVLVLVWFCLSFAFKGIGGIFLRLYNDAKEEIVGENPTNTNEENKE